MIDIKIDQPKKAKEKKKSKVWFKLNKAPPPAPLNEAAFARVKSGDEF